VPQVRKVMLLKSKGDFLMHGVVLQNRVFRALTRVSRETSPLFHVKPFSPTPLTKNPACDVSRETSSGLSS